MSYYFNSVAAICREKQITAILVTVGSAKQQASKSAKSSYALFNYTMLDMNAERVLPF